MDSDSKGQAVLKDTLLAMGDDESENIRAWVVRLLSDKPVGSLEVADWIVKRATDPSPLVRLYVASAIGRLPQAQAFETAMKLVAFEEDANDRVQPKLIWQQIEPFIAGDYEKSIRLFGVSKSQMIRRNIIRRLACDPQKQDEMLEKLTLMWVLSSNSFKTCLLYTSPSPRDRQKSRMPSSA